MSRNIGNNNLIHFSNADLASMATSFQGLVFKGYGERSHHDACAETDAYNYHHNYMSEVWVRLDETG